MAQRPFQGVAEVEVLLFARLGGHNVRDRPQEAESATRTMQAQRTLKKQEVSKGRHPPSWKDPKPPSAHCTQEIATVRIRARQAGKYVGEVQRGSRRPSRFVSAIENTFASLTDLSRLKPARQTAYSSRYFRPHSLLCLDKCGRPPLQPAVTGVATPITSP